MGLSIRNEENIAFNGGKIEAELFVPYAIGQMYYDLTQVIPLIPPKQSRKICFERQTAEISGTAMLKIKKTMPIGEDVVIEFYNKLGENMMTETRVLTFPIASREEIYQKYSVIVASFFSIIAMTISIINAIASLISLFK